MDGFEFTAELVWLAIEFLGVFFGGYFNNCVMEPRMIIECYLDMYVAKIKNGYIWMFVLLRSHVPRLVRVAVGG